MARNDAVVFTVKGLTDLQRGLRTLRQPELTGTVKVGLQEGSKKVIVPAVKKEAPIGSGSHKSARRGKRGTKGPLGKNVTARLVPRKDLPRGALVGVSTSPHAWYRHMVIKGTQMHSLAKGASVKKNTLQNAPPIHPGGRDNDFVGRAQKKGEAGLVAYVNTAIMTRYKTLARAR